MSAEEKNKKRKILWLWSCVCLIPFSLISMYAVPDFIRKRQQARPDYEYPQISDLWMTIASLAVFIPSRIILAKYVFIALGDKIIPSLEVRKHWTKKDRDARVDRFGTVVYKLCFFVGVAIYGFWVLKDTDFFPPQLGGKGSVSNCFTDFPFSPEVPNLKLYYMIELGYHGQSLLFHLYGEHRNDYLEMMLHHTCAVLLVLFSYFSNFLRIGSLVLFVHDIADVFAYALKTAVDTRYTKVTLFFYTGLLIVWAYARFYCFPGLIISGIYDAIHDVNPEWYFSLEWSYFLGMLYILLFLHIYWYCLFLLAGYSFFRTGVTQDLQHKVGGEVKVKKPRSPSTTHHKSNGSAAKIKERERLGSDAEDTNGGEVGHAKAE